MSTDWNIYCVDCDEEHYFCDANHQERLMTKLIQHAEVIGGLHDLFKEEDILLLELRTPYGGINPAWFHEHCKHHLVPRSEYGQILELKCDACKKVKPMHRVDIGYSMIGYLCEDCTKDTAEIVKDSLIK